MTNEKANEMNVERALERGNQLAFPHVGFNHNGLSKREWMATHLMSGMLAQGIGSDVAADRSVKAVNDLLIALHINQK